MPRRLRFTNNRTHMHILKLLRRLLAGAVLLGLAVQTHAQVVSAGITGTIIDHEGRPIAGAEVTARHEPTNTVSTAISRENGRFAFRGLAVGGPFTVSATAGDATIESMSGVSTILGEDVDVRLTARSEVQMLEDFVVEASTLDLDPNSTGANSVLNSQQMELVPTTNRSFADMIRTNPYVTIRAGSALTALGQNNRFNSISVDGARINDQFGLSSSGLQSTFNPFPLDALEQFSVSLSPYEARRSGFTGASVNAVTKSGTNTFHGSAYYITTDEGMSGKDIAGNSAGTRPQNSEEWIGYTLGGPIIKDRLFFFAAYETYERASEATNPGFLPDSGQLATITSRLSAINSATGMDTDFGEFQSAGSNLSDDEKRLLKLDWNISQDHRMTVRYSDTVATQPSFGSFNSTGFSGGAPLSGAPSIGRVTSLTSNFYDTRRTEEVWAGQIFSNWTPDFKTEVSYSNTYYLQESAARSIYPEVRIYNVGGVDINGNPITNGVLALGTENSRHGNDLEVKTEIYTAIADYTWKNITFTGGVDLESSDFYNLFRQSSYGVIGFRNVDDFVNDAPFASFRSVVQEGVPIADVSQFEQTGIFGQARMEVSSRLTLTAGLRVDMIDSPISPTENAAFKSAFGITNSGTPDGASNVAPRLSFNYAVDDERITQVRGGIGVFLGRAPWVFFSNSFGGTGVGRFTQSATGTSDPAVLPLVDYLNTQFDPENPVGTVSTPGNTSAITLAKPGINLPTVMRGNIAVDHQLRGIGAILSAEFIYTDVLSALFIDNMNLKPTTIGADGRQRFAGSASSNPIVPGFGNVLRMRNVDVGSSKYVTLAIDRPMTNGWSYNASYTYGDSTEAQALGSSTAGSQWQFNAVFNQNTVEKGRSDFEIKHRVLIGLAKEFTYWRNMKTRISLLYEGRTGSPYSWVYTSDLNTDGFARNDLLAVPSGVDDSRFDFSALQAAGILETYFEALEATGLSKFAGGYAHRNSFFQPWQNRLDLRFVQEIPTAGPVKVELFADFLNFGSWLSKDLFNYIETLPVPTNTGLVREFGSATYAADGRIRPTDMRAQSNSNIAINNSESRWRIQVGARLKF